ncbi:uncharacterized protein LOC143907122 [Temnothorax americanus]|uniref:uncharacterized protein LOC143907122 n=1 Tax=Temnothorax americanus TaxID=1964332 RepID=UPI004069740F
MAGALRVVRLIRVRFSRKMKRSPLNNATHSGRPCGAKHTSYNWKSHENANSRGYQTAEGNSYHRFSASGAESQPCDDNFIPLNVSTPMTRHEKYNAASQYRPAGECSSPGSGWYNNYRGNYHATPRSNCNNQYPAYKHFPKQFHRQKRKSYRGAHRQVNVSAYVDIDSFLEDPWEDLVKKLNESKDTNKSERPENESSFNSKLADSDLTERSGSKLSKETNVDDLQCSQECSVDMSFEMQNTDLSQISKVNSLVESQVGDVCSSQDLSNKSTCSNKICGVVQEKNVYLNVSLIDTD